VLCASADAYDICAVRRDRKRCGSQSLAVLFGRASQLWQPAGQWVPLNTSAPPYLLQTLHDVHEHGVRVQQCSTRSPTSFTYGWRDDDPNVPTRLLEAEELCNHLRGTNMLFIGDSLSLQIFDSWRARLRHYRFATGGQYNFDRSCQGDCEGAAPALCRGLCTNRMEHHLSSLYSSCDNGATLYLAQAFRWVLDVSSFVSSDPRGAECAQRLRRNPSNFDLVLIPPSHVANMLLEVSRPAHIHWSMKRNVRKVVVVINQFAHLHTLIGHLQMCYAATGVGSDPLASPQNVAERDVLRFWAQDQARWAATLQALQHNLSKQDVDVRVFYRTSPVACDTFCVPPNGAPRHPVDPTTLLDRAMVDAGKQQYSHHLVFSVNDACRAAFSAHGHSIIDLETMLGVRVDAHPASFDGTGDKLHFCQPGPTDWALDAIVRHALGDEAQSDDEMK